MGLFHSIRQAVAKRCAALLRNTKPGRPIVEPEDKKSLEQTGEEPMATTDNDSFEQTPVNESADAIDQDSPGVNAANETADPTEDLLADIDAAISDDQAADAKVTATDEPPVDAAKTAKHVEVDPETAPETLENVVEEVRDDADPVEAIMAEQAEAIDDNALDEIIAEQEGAVDSDEPVTEASAFSDVAADAEADIDAIASAFEEATAEIGDVANTINRAVGTDELSDLASSANPSLTTPGPTSSSMPFRDDLQNTRTALQSALSNITGLLDRLDAQYRETEVRLNQAAAFQEAAKQSYKASQEFGQAQIELGEARATYEKAQARIEIARRQWETAQQVGAETEAAVNTSEQESPEPHSSGEWSTPTDSAPGSTCRIPNP